jgi:hypothetical protein
LVFSLPERIFAKEVLWKAAGRTLPPPPGLVVHTATDVVDELARLAPGGRVDSSFERLEKKALANETWRRDKARPLDERISRFASSWRESWYDLERAWIVSELSSLGVNGASLPSNGEMEEVPSIQITAELHARLIEGDGPKPGDFMDLGYAACLPYVDLLVTDSNFADTIKTAGLDTRYGTKVLSLSEAADLAQEESSTGSQRLI